jgi:hypothetical protein
MHIRILLLTIMLALASCERKHSTKIDDDVEIDVIETSYDDHDYIIFSGHGVIHNPKCKCYEQ